VGLGHHPRIRAGSRLGLHPEGRQLPRLRSSGHDPRHQFRLQWRPAHGHAHNLRSPERRARGQGLGQQPLHPHGRGQPARDPHPRRPLHHGRGGTRSAPGRRGPDVLVHGFQGRRLAPDRRAPTRRSDWRCVSRLSRPARPTGTHAHYTDAPCSSAPTRASGCGESLPRPGVRSGTGSGVDWAVMAPKRHRRHRAGDPRAAQPHRTRRCPARFVAGTRPRTDL
jgi:hypothetical protein